MAQMTDLASSGIQQIIERQKEIVGDLERMKIVFASGNEGKVKEIREMLEEMGIQLVSLKDYADVPEIVEDGKSFLENALKKAKIISAFTGETVLADDSGLQVDVLGGEPGIYSARYAGEKATDNDNIKSSSGQIKKHSAGKKNCVFLLRSCII